MRVPIVFLIAAALLAAAPTAAQSRQDRTPALIREQWRIHSTYLWCIEVDLDGDARKCRTRRGRHYRRNTLQRLTP